MQVSLEGYLLLNFAMNMALISICARSTGSVKWGRVVFASALGALYAAVMYWSPFSLLKTEPMKLLLLAFISAIAIHTDCPMGVVKGAVRIACGTFFAGGVVLLIRQITGGNGLLASVIGIPIAGGALVIAFGAREKKLEQWEVQLMMRTRSGNVRIEALIDTGNRLHEPISGRPVLIVELEAARKLLPTDFVLEQAQASLPKGFRLVRFGALGGKGQMLCFHPDEVYASYGDGWVRAPDIWVALYPGHIPGDMQALAPPVIGSVQKASGLKRIV